MGMKYMMDFKLPLYCNQRTLLLLQGSGYFNVFLFDTYQFAFDAFMVACDI